MSVAAQVAGVLGAAGLAGLLLARDRWHRLAALGVWAASCGVLALYLLPDLSAVRLAAAGVAGFVAAVAIAWALDRWPYLLAFGTLACIPLRLPVDIGSDTVNLLLPLYAVVGGLALSLAWSLVKGDDRSRELGPVALPLAAFVAWTGLSLAWTGDVRRGAIFLGAFVLPFGLLAVGFARLPWRGRWLTWLWGALVATALAYAGVGGYQWLTRDVFWNPSVKVFNAYAPFFRVNSVFWDPSVYGRYLTVAVLASLAGILLGGARGWKIAGLYAVVVATWLGLLISFSQSSFVALAAGIVVAAAVVWGRRATLALVALGAVTCAVVLVVPQVRHDLVGKSRSGVNRITSGRANLVGQGIRIALDHPVAGVGAGGFSREYAHRRGIRGKNPKRVASHTTPVTVAAEEGLVGLALLCWLVAAALLATLRGLGDGFTSRVALATGIVLLAIGVHSLFYADFFEDPMTWALLGLVGLSARVPKKRPPARAEAVPAPPAPTAPEPAPTSP
ncbi:MAG TPA: O-antigen ligase family protein [Gaiella sp.]|nr:O-antigen ligase family protein [Gaiella sp.]